MRYALVSLAMLCPSAWLSAQPVPVDVPSLAASTGCTPDWLPATGTVPGVDGSVYAFAEFDDGGGPALYAGGVMGTAGGTVVNRIAKWDGAAWSPLGSGVSSAVHALAVFDDGSGPALYAGGILKVASGVTVNRIAKWDGATWSPLGSGMSSYVYALAVHDDGSGPALYAGGVFSVAGGVPASRVARWDGVSWSPLSSGVGNAVYALAVYDDGSGPALYAGGAFSSAGGVAANNIARWDGASWSPLGSGLGHPVLNGTVKTLAVHDDGSGPALYAGGYFTTAGGETAKLIAKWDGANWSPVFSGLGNGAPFDAVRALAVFDDGSGPALYAGGEFTLASGFGVTNRVAKWDGAAWSALGSGVNADVHALAPFNGGSGPALAVGGDFSISPAGDSYLAKWGCPSPWTDLGFALAGVDGNPALAGGGPLTAGSAGTLTLSQAAPSALSLLFASFASTPAPFKCGTLVPVPLDVAWPLTTDGSGSIPLGWPIWPAGLSGSSLYFQYGIQDAAASCGVALSNALRADVP